MKKIIAFVLAFAPAIASAQTTIGTSQITDADSLITKLTNIGNTVIQILIAFAVIFIVYSVVMYMIKSGTDDAAKFRSNVLWGIVGLFVILSVWGLVRILSNTFRTDSTAPVSSYPKITYPN